MEAIRLNPKEYFRNLNYIVNGDRDIQLLSIENITRMFLATEDQKRQAEIETMRDIQPSPFSKLIDKMFTKYGLEKG